MLLTSTVTSQTKPPRSSAASSTTTATESVRPRRRRWRKLTRGASRKVRNTASATGMKTRCAQYKQLTTTTPTTVPVRAIRARCQPGAADVFATDQDLQGEACALANDMRERRSAAQAADQIARRHAQEHCPAHHGPGVPAHMGRQVERPPHRFAGAVGRTLHGMTVVRPPLARHALSFRPHLARHERSFRPPT